uniref:Putative ovule protein n=1 Tax=Solanum chacoense TaxID=4108 RepID=A0A0V0GNV5_SOLCH
MMEHLKLMAKNTEVCLVSFSTFRLPDVTSHTQSKSLLSLTLLLLCFNGRLLSASYDTLKKHSSMVFVFPNRNRLLFVPMQMLIGQVTSMIAALSRVTFLSWNNTNFLEFS